MSLTRISVKDNPPELLIEDFAKSIAAKNDVYVPMVFILGQLEPYLETKKDFDIVRVFHREDDAQKYLSWVATKLNMNENSARFWVLDPTKLCIYLSKIASSRKRILRCIGSGVYNNKIYDLDLFWTNDQTLML